MLDIDITKDIYFQPALGEIYAKMQKAEFVEFMHSCAYGTIRHNFIKRKITLPEDIQDDYYDLITPYGYGGPLIVESFGDDKHLIESFNDAFTAYCSENHVISEFVRFHPLSTNAQDFSSMYDPILYNHTVGTNLEDYEDPFAEEFSKSCRKNVRKCFKNGLEYELVEEPDSLEDFQEIYYQTMDRNDAESKYYFESTYFQEFVEHLQKYLLKVRVLYEGKTIAMGMYFKTDDLLHTHLSGTLTDYLYLSPAYVLRYALMEYGKKYGMKYIHHGGGTTSAENDSLYLFKKQFGKNTEFPFFMAKKIWDEEKYHAICQALGKEEDVTFFPAYRA